MMFWSASSRIFCAVSASVGEDLEDIVAGMVSFRECGRRSECWGRCWSSSERGKIGP